MDHRDNCYPQSRTLDEYIDRYPQVDPMRLSQKTKLPAEVKEPWVKWLQDPEHQDLQANGTLTVTQYGKLKNCCLGVLCEYIVPEKLNKKVEPTHTTYQVIDDPYKDWASSLLPQHLADEYGMSTRGDFTFSFRVEGHTFYQRTDLAKENDSGLTFTQIGDLINYFF